jgi:hypothetical protein
MRTSITRPRACLLAVRIRITAIEIMVRPCAISRSRDQIAQAPARALGLADLLRTDERGPRTAIPSGW